MFDKKARFIFKFFENNKIFVIYLRLSYVITTLRQTTKLTLKGTSSNVQDFDWWQERSSIYRLKIASQFLTSKR